MARFCLRLLSVGLLLAPVGAVAATHEELQHRLDTSVDVLKQILAASDSGVPLNILEQATCVAVIPGLKKGAFLVGGEFGAGVATCRTGHGWSAPVFLNLQGGSWGLQIGGQSTDLVLIAVNDHGLQDLLKDKFKVGADASAAAGPVGRTGQAATDWKLSAELLTYSRTRGLFAGIALDGARVSQSNKDDEEYYGHPLQFDSILRGNVDVPEGARPFVRSVARAFVRAKHDQ